jgi:endonuclease/exonuclease/phosphatase family metal-dependent hydrolase
MKIATLNIDWAKKYRSKNHYLEVENFLSKIDFDFLILTEAIDLKLDNYKYKSFSEQIPENIDYEELDYSKYLKKEKSFRTAIYSNIKPKKYFPVIDNKTSLAVEFETALGNIVIYATIIGTQYKKMPFAKNELDNCITDCRNIVNSNKNIIIVGDLNTSFNDNEKDYTISNDTTKALKNLFTELSLINPTEKIEENIDHIVVPLNFEKLLAETVVFVAKDELSDHKGVYVELLF